MRILLTGGTGQLGTELIRVLPSTGELIIGVRDADQFDAHGRQKVSLDLSDLPDLRQRLDEIQPDLIVNAAAYTAVDKAESESGLAHRINADAPGLMAHWAAKNGARLIHYSTDYVFDGEAQQAYSETDTTNPLNEYGLSKLAGERAIRAAEGQHLIMRTSWVYAPHGQNFVKTMLGLAAQGRDLNVVGDQYGRPTAAHSLAYYTEQVLKRPGIIAGAQGADVVHAADSARMNWYEFADAVFHAAVKQGMLASLPELSSIPSSGYPQAAVRPKYSVLNTDRMLIELGVHPVDFDAALSRCLLELDQ